MGNEDLAAGSAYFEAVVREIVEQDSEILPHLMELWFATLPRLATDRTTWRAEWRAGDGTLLQFNSMITGWDDFDGITINDWHPADAATWQWLNARS